MQYGHFDNEKREYVIDRVDLPTSWTNYLGVDDMCTVINHTAGGYSFFKSPEHHRMTRFRPNGVPMDFPGYYIYLKDREDGDFWTISWQPVGKSLEKAVYRTRFGLSYAIYECTYKGIEASQKMFIPKDDTVLLMDVRLKNNSDSVKKISAFSYLEFSFHEINIDNQNFQMSLYCAGSSYEDGVIEEDLYYEKDGFTFFTSNFNPDGYDCVRDEFIGPYRTEANPLAVENGLCTGSRRKGGNHAGVLQKNLEIMPGEEVRLIYMMGDGDRSTGLKYKERYSKSDEVDIAFDRLKTYWDQKLSALSIKTPNRDMDTMINIWTLYQSEVNVAFSRFASFIEVGGRTGLGFRDTSQDAMTIPLSEPKRCRTRIIQLMKGLTSKGYGLHLFDPADFEPEKKEESNSPTIKGAVGKDDVIHGIEGACSDDALWLIPAVTEYIRETGDFDLLREDLIYADTYFDNPDFKESLYDHMKRILDFTAEHRGKDGICLGLRADWNDCLNLGGGESAMTTFLFFWALKNFLELTDYLIKTGSDISGLKNDAEKYKKILEEVREASERELFDENGHWYVRGITASGRKIGTFDDEEGRVHLESNSWAVLSGEAAGQRALDAVKAMDEWLYTPYGLRLNTPSYTKVDDEIGFVTRVYPGLKENGSIFSHPNPWAWGAACKVGRGDIAMKFYNALCPGKQNDMIEIRKAEPYSTCQFITGPDHTAYGEARHPFMTGSGGWSYYAATHYILGIRPDFDGLVADPCIPAGWTEFEISRRWRNAFYDIHVSNPEGHMCGVASVRIDGEKSTDEKNRMRGVKLPVFSDGKHHKIEIEMA